jgi:omega-6 fatty acid desaturase / acyl-lipid omega-6 desaturase (Delta-12 desaturase)
MCKGGTQDVSSRVVKEKFDGLSSSSTTYDNSWKSPYNPLDPNAPALPTKGEIKAVIPKECFERSYFWSFYYLLRDIVFTLIIIVVSAHVLNPNVPEIVNFKSIALWLFGWSMYAFWMGSIGGAIWIIGHECGHGAFSPSPIINDIIGNIVHHALLVPYFAWQYSHAKHHRRTNHITDGETHVPNTKRIIGLGPNNERTGADSVWHDMLGDTPFAALVIWTHLFAGWPAYLLGTTSTGTLKHDGTLLGPNEFADHFRPNSPMFSPKVYNKILFSTIIEIASIVGLVYAGHVFGHLKVVLWYWNPYLVVNAWLVLYTWLQHTDPSVPHYGEGEWTWVRGALSTIDRPYGILDYFHHNIGSTHVVHHLFHEIPFYNAKQATLAVKAYLEPKGLYNYDPTFWPLALWKIAHSCHYVDKLDGIQYYKSLENIPRTCHMNNKKKVV